MSDFPAIYQRPAELLQQLIRFNTTNPPGNEAECIGYIHDLMTRFGFETTILAKDPARPNLIVRLKGRGEAPPLLLQGHVDVVTTANQDWQFPPFEGRILDGYVWGRGALDMKSGIAMILCALMRMKAEGVSPPGDIVATILSDEEYGGVYGAGYLVEEHPYLFQGVRYSIGEVGGNSAYIDGRKLYPIMVAEKQVCWMQLTVRGPGGHASLPHHGGAMAKLGHILQTLDRCRLPVHITPVVRAMITAYADALPEPTSGALRRLLDPAQTDAVLDQLGEHARHFDPLLHNTVNATMVRGGVQINVIPSEIVLDVDGRLLPGFAFEDMEAELRALLGVEFELKTTQYHVNSLQPDMALYDMLAGVLRELDPEGAPVPFVLGAVTDGAYFARLGIQNYGFLPLNMPPDFEYVSTIHAADERVPVAAVEFGTEALYRALQRFGVQ